MVARRRPSGASSVVLPGDLYKSRPVTQMIYFTSLGVWSCGKMLPLYQLRCAYCARVTLNFNPPNLEVAVLAVKDAAARSEAQRRDPCLHVAPPGIFPELLPVDFISFMCLSVAMKSCSKANKDRGRRTADRGQSKHISTSCLCL